MNFSKSNSNIVQFKIIQECRQVEIDEGVIVTKTSSNKPKLIKNGHEFIIDKTHGEKVYWKCDYKKIKCGVRLHTDLNHKPLNKLEIMSHPLHEPEDEIFSAY
ncbi:unnamed protein product [Brachionus calyciflorus]|uniref:FLYWCH-type domain-containing protein n=1 Tax=Brachionus calyciflorus TaxID=104777 RepID=A0A814FZ85_9BILA|nr:unnamed protein product [Brachionus calyciflorus]